MGFLDTVLKSFLGDKNAKDLKEIKKVVDKIKKVEPAIEQLSDDELRGKTQEFKEKIAAATEDITKQIAEVKEQIKTTTNVDEKEQLFVKIEELKKDSYQIEEKVLAEILPEAFAVVKETARRLAQNGGLTVKNAHDMVMAATKDFVEIKDGNAFWKNKWDAAVKKLFGIWFTTTLNLLEV
jgi:preprotein translocase subunit SecA